MSHKLTLSSSEQSIKAAADEKGDEDVLRDIRGVDLLGKEFQVHDKCRIDYIRKSSVNDQYEDMSENIGRFEAVKKRNSGKCYWKG